MFSKVSQWPPGILLQPGALCTVCMQEAAQMNVSSMYKLESTHKMSTLTVVRKLR